MNNLVKRLLLLIVMAVLTTPQVHAAADGPAAAKPKEVQLSGKVLETMDGGGYTYLQLQNGADKVWVAIPLSKVSVGQQVNLIPGFEIKNFTSKGLNRKFDKVIFSGGFANADKVQLSPQAIKMVHQGVPNAGQTQPVSAKQPAQQAQQAKSQKPAPKTGKVAKAKGANAYTVAEVYAKKGKLEKKQVTVRGRVVRVSQRIMKKNWVHLEDGSGSKAKKTDNLVFTTKDLPKEGDVVTATGTVYNNLDFGSGYRYTVLVQDANFKK